MFRKISEHQENRWLDGVQDLVLVAKAKKGHKVYVHKIKANLLLGRNTVFSGTETQENFLFRVSTNRAL